MKRRLGKRLVLGIALATVAIVLVPTSYMHILAAVSYTDGWDVAGDLAGWRANTAWTNVEVSDTGGNPSGYLFTESDGSPNPSTYYAGALTEKEEFTGDYGFAPTVQISVDLKVLEDTSGLSGVYLRFRYLDSTYNGWRYLLTNAPAIGEWVTYTVTVDPNWSDIEATSAGWVQEDSSVSFSETMEEVYTAEVRLEGTGPIFAGIDNFTVGAVGSNPPGWDKGEKKGWDDSSPPGLDKKSKTPPGHDRGKKNGWSSE